MFVGKAFGILLALGLWTVDVNAHGRISLSSLLFRKTNEDFVADGMKRNHHHHHNFERQESESVCSTCTTSTLSSWIPYDQAVFATSTVTAWTTQMVLVDTFPATTVTTTLSSVPAATGTSQKAKRQLGSGYAMTFTPYDESTGNCLQADAILAQLQQIKSLGFGHIRLYGVDCGQLDTVADQAISLGFTVTLGIYIDSTGTQRGYSDLATLIQWGKWSANIAYINIGISLQAV